MRYTTNLNNLKCLEWEINAQQGILFSLLYDANNWAKEIVIEENVFYFVSRNLIIKELPMFFEKADTVYRHLKTLALKGLIEHSKKDKMDLIRITEKGKEWNFAEHKNSSEKNPNLDSNSEKNPNLDSNSEKNPKKLGKKSENSSEKNPTYKDTILHNNTILKNIYTSEKYTSENFSQTFQEFLSMRKELKKPATPRAVERIIKKLEKVDNEAIALKMLKNSIIHSWQDVYEIQEKYDKRKVNGSSFGKSIEEIDKEQKELQLIYEKYLHSLQIENGGA